MNVVKVLKSSMPKTQLSAIYPSVSQLHCDLGNFFPCSHACGEPLINGILIGIHVQSPVLIQLHIIARLLCRHLLPLWSIVLPWLQNELHVTCRRMLCC